MCSQILKKDQSNGQHIQELCNGNRIRRFVVPMSVLLSGFCFNGQVEEVSSKPTNGTKNDDFDNKCLRNLSPKNNGFDHNCLRDVLDAIHMGVIMQPANCTNKSNVLVDV